MCHVQSVPLNMRFDFKKLRWIHKSNRKQNPTNKLIKSNYENFTNIVNNRSKKHILKGCRFQYVAELGKASSGLFEKYKQDFER